MKTNAKFVVVLALTGLIALGCGSQYSIEEPLEEIDDNRFIESIESASHMEPEDEINHEEHFIANPQLDDEATGGLALIAHAGSAVQGLVGSNSLEALVNAVSHGFTYIELDMLPTSDGKIVLNHDWEHISNRVLGVANGIMTHSEFMENKIFERLTPVDLEMLIGFLDMNPGIRIITDTKDTGYAALYAIAASYPEHLGCFIPQAYSFEDIRLIRGLGFDDVIITLYTMDQSIALNPEAINSLAQLYGVYGVTLPDGYFTAEYAAMLDTAAIRYMTHTVDNMERAVQLQDMGIYGIYTGILAYSATEDALIFMSPSPAQDYIDKIKANYGNLPPGQRHVANEAVFYKIGVPARVYLGEVLPTQDIMAAPFEDNINGGVYLLARHFEHYSSNYIWIGSERALNITYNGQRHTFRESNLNEIYLYMDLLFLSERTVEAISPYNVHRQGEYIVLAHKGSQRGSNQLIKIAETLFENVGF